VAILFAQLVLFSHRLRTVKVWFTRMHPMVRVLVRTAMGVGFLVLLFVLVLGLAGWSPWGLGLHPVKPSV